ncbi:hypothetical protein [Actinomycetospora aeridis]|uniref:Uncharacterized protein n=1 Tax=Actinomycetospora aeridis TaxID=3129231 RepID=A0ABU8N5T7_9PSEU
MTVSGLVGAAFVIALAATPLSAVIAVAILRRYRHQVAALTGQRAIERRPRAWPERRPGGGGARWIRGRPAPLEIVSRRAARRCLAIHLLPALVVSGGSAVVVLRTSVFVGTEPTPEFVATLILLILAFGCPVLVVARALLIPSRRVYVGAIVALLVGVALLGMVAVGPDNWALILLGFVAPAVVPAAVVLLSAPTALRGVGWLFTPITLAVVFAFVLMLALIVVPQPPDGATAGAITATAIGSVLVTSAVVAAVWWAYRTRRIDDVTEHAVVLWFSQAPWLCMWATFEGTIGDIAVGLAPFAAFVVSVPLVQVCFQRPQRDAPRHLLLLRSFAGGRRSVSLLRDVSRSWRYLGAVVLIGGVDLAGETLEPDEAVDWFLGRVGRRVITDEEDAPARVAASDLRADPDGRHRVHDILCGPEAWHATFAAIIAQVAVVLIDLRGAADSQGGLAWEVDQLATSGVTNVVVLADKSTRSAWVAELESREPGQRGTYAPRGPVVVRPRNGAAGARQVLHALTRVADDADVVHPGRGSG